MPETGPIHPLSYRREIVAPLFELISSGESVALAGAPGIGKSRLLQFLLRVDVQQHYLPYTPPTWLIAVDCNRIAALSAWGLYELMFTSLIENYGAQLDNDLRNWFNSLRMEVITSENSLLARRHMELVTRILCLDKGVRLCFIFDEFDEVYKTIPVDALANLRALRDMDRYSVCYLLMIRDAPDRLRTPDDHEGFYELFSRSVLGLKPYQSPDARRIIAQIKARRGGNLTSVQEEAILNLSGGHPSLLVALCDNLIRAKENAPARPSLEWAIALPNIEEEFRKLWLGLTQDEKLALSRLAQRAEASMPGRVHALLLLKGLVVNEPDKTTELFSPLAYLWISTRGELSQHELWIDKQSAVVCVEGKRISDLSRLEFNLLCYMYDRLGEVCTRDALLTHLYPDEQDNVQLIGSANRIDSLVRHVRKAIEPVPGKYRYLLNVRGHGYKLVDKPTTL